MQDVLNICKSARQVRDTGLTDIYKEKFKKLTANMKKIGERITDDLHKSIQHGNSDRTRSP